MKKTNDLFLYCVLAGLIITHEYFFVQGVIRFGFDLGWW